MNTIPNIKLISEYYDRFSIYQKKTGFNIRIRTILKNLKKAGLQRNSSILEIGCGIGILTKQLGNYMLSGKIISTDISPKSIEIAKIKTKHFSNIEFFITDMSNFNSKHMFDFILLADVLEHIPIENHISLFRILSDHLHPDGKIAINIPSPYHIKWKEKFDPQSLQIIDQALSTDTILPAFYHNNLYLLSLNTYSLYFKQGDYQWMILKKSENINDLQKKQRRALFIQEIRGRIF